MSSVNRMREFISARLVAAAEEIFVEFEKTISQYQEEINRHRQLLEITSKPQIHLQTADVRHQHEQLRAEDPQDDQSLKSDLNEKQTECAQIKEEEVELLLIQEEEQLFLKEEQNDFLLTDVQEENDPIDAKPNVDSASSSVFPLVETSHAEEMMPEGSGPVHEAEKIPEKSQFDHVDGREILVTPSSFKPLGKKQFPCHMCEKPFKTKSELKIHVRIHTGEKPYSCKTCGKCFTQTGHLLSHMMTHTGEKPHSCSACGKSFTRHNILVRHMRSHLSEKPPPCVLCGKAFTQQKIYMRHMKSHGGGKFPSS